MAAGKIACFVVLCMVIIAHTEGLSCGQVVNYLTPCIGYLRNAAPLVASCCAGVDGLANAAKSTADRQAACNCLKKEASAIPGINDGKAAGLPGLCKVNIPYKISRSTDCAKIR